MVRCANRAELLSENHVVIQDIARIVKTMNEETFAIFYIKDGQYYPVAMTQEQNNMIQLTLKALFAPKVTIIDQPFGSVVNLAQKKTSQDGNPASQQHIKNNLKSE